MQEINFKKRIVAFIDILGFKEVVRKNKELLSEVLKLLYQIKEKNGPFTGTITPKEVGSFNIGVEPDISSYSDNIIISYPLDDQDLHPEGTDYGFILFCLLNNLAEYINYFHIEALKIGLSFRGAIAVGDLYLDLEQNIIIGEPLIEAIEDESKLANYPRIVCSKSLLEYDKKIHKNSRTSLSTKFTRDFDGLYFIDYMKAAFVYFVGMEQFFALIEIRKQIELSIIANKSNLTVLSKWYWLAHHFNLNLDYWKNKTDKLNKINAFDSHEKIPLTV